jgi:glyoxylase-like metal-dependent hydrolase (beta-lactamase superfamily II)
MLHIETLVLGPVQTNAYLIADPESSEAAVIDPAWDGALILRSAQEHGWHIRQLWFTHAHFDHIGGAGALVKALQPPPSQALHPADLPLWRAKGGAPLFGLRFDSGPEPETALAHGQNLHLGTLQFEVRHAPGHTPGHVLLYCAAQGVLFCGDVIFAGGIGRTDLPGGDYPTLIHSIESQVLTLPDDTRLLSGHGEATTVGWEKRWNAFLT